MSIENEINRIGTNVQETLNVIAEMGGTVPENATSNDMPNAARTIPIGAKIDDSAPAADKTYSSQKIESSLNELKEKNAAQDEALTQLNEANDAQDKRIKELEDAEGYTLPTASADTIGGVKVGNGLAIDENGVLSLALADGDEVSY